jgi:acid phosphatase
MPITVSHFVFTTSAVICLVGSVVFLLAPTSFQLYTPFRSDSSPGYETFSLATFYEGIPYTSSWRSWWHPERGGRSSIKKGWNLLYHLGGNGPWIEKVDGVVDGGIGVPEGCNVEQVHMVWWPFASI